MGFGHTNFYNGFKKIFDKIIFIKNVYYIYMKNLKKDKRLIYLIYFLLLIIFLYMINRYLNKEISENFAAIASKPLTAAQIKKLIPAQINKLTTAQIKMLTPTQIGAIVPIVISKISATFFNNLSSLPNNNQISGLTKNQISAISPNIIPNINATFFNNLTNNQITSLTNNQMIKLTLIQINNINKSFFTMANIANFKKNPNINLINEKIKPISSNVNILQDIHGLQVGIQQNNPPQNISSTTPSSNVNIQQNMPGLIVGIQQNNAPLNISSTIPPSTTPFSIIPSSTIPPSTTPFSTTLYSTIPNPLTAKFINDNINNLNLFKPLNIQTIPPTEIPIIDPKFFNNLQDNQVKALTSSQIQAITPDRITNDLSMFFSFLLPIQITYLTPPQITKICVQYNQSNRLLNHIFLNLTPEQLSKLTSKQVGSLTLQTLNLIPDTNFQYLNANGILLLSDDIIKNCFKIRWSNFTQAQKNILNINQGFFNLLLSKGGCPSDPSPCKLENGLNPSNVVYGSRVWVQGPNHVADGYYSSLCEYYSDPENTDDGPTGTIPCYCRYCM